MIFCCKKYHILSHVENKEGTKLDPGKIEAILHFPEPKMATNIKSFLGLPKYY
jgi:hypothetical protein